jgi:hypothetical protein
MIQAEKFYSGADQNLANSIVIFLTMIFAMTPFLIYFKINKKCKFDNSTNPIAKLFNYLFEKRIYDPNPNALEIFKNKDSQWQVLFVGVLFLVSGSFLLPKLTLPVTGADDAGKLIIHLFFVIVQYLLGVYFFIIAYKEIMDKRPTLLLTNEKIIYRHQQTEGLPYVEISSVNLTPKSLDILGGKGTLNIDIRNLEYNSEQLLTIISKKINSPATSIRDICNDILGNTYTPNSFPIFDRIYHIIILLLLPYVIYGLINDKLIIPTRRGVLELYGISIIIMLFAAIFLSVYVISYIVDHYDLMDNEKIYRKIRSYCSRLGYAAFFLALAVSIFQHTQDYVVKNIVLKSVTLPEINMNAYLIKQYGALHDPMNDESPTLLISVYPSNLTQLPNKPFNSVSFDRCEVKNFYWEGGKLVVEYSVQKEWGWNASLSKRAPIPIVLKRVSS